MANYNTLQDSIRSAIKTNGNNEITGNLLQQILLSMVTTLGAQFQFAGVATQSTNPGTPDYNVAYLAGPGTYQNMGGVVVPSGSIGVIAYNGSWAVQLISVGGGGGGGSVVTFNDLPNGTTQILVDGTVSAIIPSQYTLLKLSAFTTTSEDIANGAFYYNTSDKKIYQKRDFVSVVIPYYDGAIYTYNNALYVWNGTDLVNVGGGGGSADFLPEPDDLALVPAVQQGDPSVLKFANRAYNSQNPNGMGYKILRKDAAFASQVTDTNTIYEIRYDFNLNNTTINVPNGCVLRFNGGSIRNGTLNGDFLIDSDNNKIYYSVVFTGECTRKQIFNVRWFVANVSKDIGNLVSCATELQAAVNSGAESLTFTNELYYCPTTINITTPINIYGEMCQRNNTNTPETKNDIKVGIYTDGHNKVFNFNLSNGKEATIKIDGLVIVSDYSTMGGNYTYDSVPVIEFNNGNIMDVELNTDIFFISSKDQNLYRENHGVGVQINAGNDSYYCFIKAHDVIHNALVGYKLITTGTGWIADFNHDGNLYATKGLITYAGIAILRGSYQSENGYNTAANGEGYIDAYGSVYLYSLIYDLGTEPGQYVGSTPQYAVVRKRTNVDVVCTVPDMLRKIPPYMPVTKTQTDLFVRSVLESLYSKSPEKVSLSVFLTSGGNDTDITNECVFSGHNNLFNPYISDLFTFTYPNQYDYQNIKFRVSLTGLRALDFLTFGRNYLWLYTIVAGKIGLGNAFQSVDISMVNNGIRVLNVENVVLKNEDYNINKFVFPIDALSDLLGNFSLTITFKDLRQNENFVYVYPFGIDNENGGKKSGESGGVISQDLTINSVVREVPVSDLPQMIDHIYKGANLCGNFGYYAPDIYLGSFDLLNATYNVVLFGKCWVYTTTGRFAASDFQAFIRFNSGDFSFGVIRHNLFTNLQLNGIVDKTANLVHIYLKPSGISGGTDLGFDVTDLGSEYGEFIKWVVYKEDITGHNTTPFSLTPTPINYGDVVADAMDGTLMFDSWRQKLYIRDNNLWKDAMGYPVAFKSGAFTSKPSAAAVGAGYCYFDETNNRPIWSNGTDWYDAIGQQV